MVSVPVIVPLKAPGSLQGSSRKWQIDTSTRIEIHSNTKDCVLFYTLDCTKPDPFKKIGEKTTYQYQSPFTLKHGKRTVKALAVLKSGLKESSVNTKVFQVVVAAPQAIESDDDEESNKTSWANQHVSDDDDFDNSYNDSERKMFKKVIGNSLHHEEKKAPQSMIRRVVTAYSPVETTSSPDFPQHFNNTRSPIRSPVNNNNFLPDEVLRCLSCHTPRPRDPYARFCNGCKSILPPAPGCVRMSYRDTNVEYQPCKNCGSIIPADSSNCGVCSEALKKTRGKVQNGRIKCEHCSTLNPMHTTECLVCDEKLNNELTKIKSPPPSKPTEDFISCSSCDRINCGDSRFCDWCGEKVKAQKSSVTCKSCSTENDTYSQYCCNCGQKLSTPLRRSFQDTLGDMVEKQESSTMELLATLTMNDSKDESWKQINIGSPPTRKRFKNISIQAGDGIIEKSYLHPEQSILNKQTPMIKLSPGKGYWRQQIDHVGQQLKIYAQNNIEFRESFSQYVMAGLKSVNMEVKEEELTLSAQFTIKTNSGKKNKKFMPGNNESGETLIHALLASKNPSSIINSRPESAKSTTSRPSSRPSSRPNSARSTTSTSSRPSSARKKKKTITLKKMEKEKITKKLSKLTEEELKLLSILKSSKSPNIEKFEVLLENENTNPDTKDENDIPLLKLCIKNKHIDLLKPLLSAGADINLISGVKENTALHECVLQGVSGRDSLNVLLNHKAIDLDVHDKKGQTAYVIALESGIDLLTNQFTAVMSKDLLNDVMKI